MPYENLSLELELADSCSGDLRSCDMQRKRMPNYLKRAKKRFLQGLWHTSPVDAVLAGKRTLEEWVDIVADEHDIEMQSKSRQQKRPFEARDSKTERLEI
jgi:hypothetical protein